MTDKNDYCNKNVDQYKKSNSPDRTITAMEKYPFSKKYR